MNFALSDEQEFLKEAARAALSRFATVAAAREALDGGALPDLWPTAAEAGWTGLLVAENRGGAGLAPLEAMLVFEELGRVLAATPLLGHLPATFLLDRAGAGPLEALAAGEARAAFVPARPPGEAGEAWTTDPAFGVTRGPAPVLEDGHVTGRAAWVPDAPGAAWLVVACQDGRAALVAAEDAEVEAVVRYDATRSLGHVALEHAPAAPLDLPEATVRAAWYLAQALLGAEALGGVGVALETSVAYARERHTFGRAIGSYQAVKHELVEILRRLENARSLMYYAGWAAQDAPEEFALAASAFRLAAGQAADHATRTQISVHGGIGATWEHDAPLFFRRAQLSRRLLAGHAGAADAVAGELFDAARSQAAA
jgi:alkylation response protein AidB-like acyl-CoA dehydrogenase